jgi:cytochrome c5
MRLFLLAIFSGVTIGLAGCRSAPPSGHPASSSAPVLDAAAAQAAGLSVQEADEAARLYTAKCARCHKFYDPVTYNDTEWRIWMAKMSKKARLKPGQDQLLSRYLECFRTMQK